MNDKKIDRIVNKYFSFLKRNYNIEKSFDTGYEIMIILSSHDVSLKIVYEYRDLYCSMLFRKIMNGKKYIGIRESFGDLADLYEEKGFILNSFYLDEILEFKKIIVKFDYTIGLEKMICHLADLTKKYAMEFVKGNEEAYLKMDKWMRKKITRK
jgi:hypothetical protein